MWVYGLDWAGPGQRQVTDACECGNEPSVSVKCGEFLDQLQTSQLLKKDSAPQSMYIYIIYMAVHDVTLSRLFDYVCQNHPKCNARYHDPVNTAPLTILQDRQFNMEARSPNHCYRGKAPSVTYSECVFVVLVIEHALRM